MFEPMEGTWSWIHFDKNLSVWDSILVPLAFQPEVLTTKPRNLVSANNRYNLYSMFKAIDGTYSWIHAVDKGSVSAVVTTISKTLSAHTLSFSFSARALFFKAFCALNSSSLKFSKSCDKQVFHVSFFLLNGV